ncbi:hypothetical protein A7E78_06345 [Syntrophotalea acetylenivorans]|uniref:DUF4037 domain-containing protein n=2 Tax=Syntrophotalea acetylenivorans TaxID=1842532 RepID=A0A1L3GNI5_9BACT|nr:hypothetical protein A7E78_06345 [Syntrophotalea acetylenivorans]
MKGLQLSKDYFLAHGLPMIQERFSDLADRIAVGLVGPGSECYGFDDALSRDHDWGPGFCLWLSQKDFTDYGPELDAAYRELPQTFAGFGPRQTSPGEEGRMGVLNIAGFYARYTGLDHPPEGLREWLGLSDQALGVCTNGAVFHDPDDHFSAWRRHLLDYYPEDIRRKKIASRCMTLAQTGQYNLLRSLQRNEPFASRYAELQFCHDLMSMAFLLNRRYAPFYKWLHRATAQLPVLGSILHKQINRLLNTDDGDQKVAIIEELCGLVVEEMQSQGLSDSKSSFLLDHGPRVQAGILDPDLRKHFTVFN